MAYERPGVKSGQVLARYLRAGGVYFEGQGQALMAAPLLATTHYRPGVA
jgi:hypothetical protein